MKGKRFLALVLCAAMVMALLPMPALAENTTGLEVVAVDETIVETGGTAKLRVLLKNANTVPQHAYYVQTSQSGRITSVSVTPNNEGKFTVPESNQENMFLTLSINPDVAARETPYPETLYLYFEGHSEPVEVKFDLQKTSLSPAQKEAAAKEEQQEDPTNPNTTLQAPLVLDSMGQDGLPIPAPSGNAGDRVQLRLTLWNRSFMGGNASKLSAITLTPVLSANLDNFPFEIESVDYSRKLADMGGGQRQEVVYDFKLSEKATAGVKEVKFNAVYFNNAKQAFENTTFSVFVTVVKGAEGKDAPIVDGDGNPILSTPKIIVDSYTVLPEQAEEGDDGSHLYAGEGFELKFNVLNTSDDEAVENIQISVENANGTILPAQGSSNSMYIKKIAAGESEEKSIRLQTVPDAEAKAHSLTISFKYESGKTQQAYEAVETITLPILHRMRVKMDPPTIYENMVMAGNSVGVYFRLFNMGKASLYNCMVDVEGEGLKMEESYFGGNIAAGGSMNADFNIIASTPGEIEGNIVVTYEDVYGEATVQKQPFTLTVMDEAELMGDMPADDGIMMDPGMEVMGEANKTGLPWWAIAGIAAAGVIVLLVVLLQVRKNHRKKELEDL